MSFGVSIDQGAFEYSGGNFKGLFAQKSNFFRLRFWLMVKDILRFYREAPRALDNKGAAKITLGEYLHQNKYSKELPKFGVTIIVHLFKTATGILQILIMW